MVKSRMSRKVRILGLTLPLWAWLAIPTSIALAAFAGNLLISGNVSGTAGGVTGADMSLVSVSCTASGAPGSASCTIASPASFDMSLGGQDNDSLVSLSAVVRNDGESAACLQALPVWVHGTVTRTGGISVGEAIPPATTGPIELRFGFGNVVSSQDLATSIELNFDVTGCS